VTNSFGSPSRVSPAQAANPLPSFQVKRGFRIELAAAEPMVAAPAALAFDERGRLFVAEMRDYPDRRDQSPHLGRIRMLEDLDENGVFQTSTVYAGDLPWPSAVACYGGGIFVAATPQILYLKDSVGNGTADVVRVVFSGFGARPYVPDPKALLNSFNWGLDNCLHCGTAGLGGRVSGLSEAQVPSVPLGAGDFAFDPRTLVIFLEAGPARTGMSFDNRGRKFLCDSNRPLRLAMYEPRYLARNPFSVAPPELLEEVFELNESLDELREAKSSGADTASLKHRLEAAETNFEGKLREVDGELQNAAREWDNAIDGSVDPTQRKTLMSKLNELLNRRSYIRNLVVNVQKELL